MKTKIFLLSLLLLLSMTFFAVKETTAVQHQTQHELVFDLEDYAEPPAPNAEPMEVAFDLEDYATP